MDASASVADRLNDPFGRLAALPASTFDREHRVKLLKEVSEALLECRLPSKQARVFVGSAIQAYLREGGRLDRDFLQVHAPRGSHLKPEILAAKKVPR